MMRIALIMKIINVHVIYPVANVPFLIFILMKNLQLFGTKSFHQLRKPNGHLVKGANEKLCHSDIVIYG